MEYFGLHVKIIDTIFALLGFYFLLTCKRETLPWIGFFIGIFWFYWVSFSFRYYDLAYLMPLVILGFGLSYALFFQIIALLGRTIELRAILLFGLSFFTPFGFNWFKPELIFINSYFSTDLYFYALFLGSLILFIKFKKYIKIVAIIGLLSLMFFNTPKNIIMPDLNIAIPNTNLNQSMKWEDEYKNQIVNKNFFYIEEAIKAKKDLIILHESAFPLYLNKEPFVLNKLKTLSHKITIVTGGLHVKENRVFNSSYFFKNGEFQIADKVVLVPFGEEIPLPKWAVKLINDTFFNGADDYKKATKVSDFNIKNYSFRNAICYEATTNTIFQNKPKYMIAMSNNAWFTPSIEPTLQNLLLKLYARKYDTVIYHSANSGKSGVIMP